ncbi:PDDEXK nuclease domain-containing protein [Flavobacterium sp.]|uniref:PDDEXK nuclease domain-containing protein n=1 Tax=Flavobacterium sp. TaxID=239 RepID=UPI003D0DAEB5
MTETDKLFPLDNLLNEIALLIEQSKHQAIVQSNSLLTQLFWSVGTKINHSILENKRGNYGKQIVVSLSRELTRQYGRNFEEKNLRRMLQFAEQFSNYEIVVTLSRQLSWSHVLLLLPLKEKEAKYFYINQISTQGLSVRELRKQIATKTFERISIANIQANTETTIPKNTFKDPYLLDFLDLDNSYLEKDLEKAILMDLESFILELGKGFAFIERQKRMIIDNEDFYLDLLFYHRKLKRLVAIELKIGKFQAQHKGQMELYLKWLDKNERQDDENPPIGLILCAESSREQIELLEMGKDGIMVAEYWTELLPRQQFEAKIHNLLSEAREKIEIKKLL